MLCWYPEDKVTRMTLPRKDKAPIIVPASFRRRAGIKPDQPLEFKASAGVITITSKPEVADDEYTPEQRRKILVDLKLAEKDIAEGRFYGPFNSGAEVRDFIEGEIKKPAAAKRKRRG
jgi:bifunctional DNA-binding transcriptional regulator/antitoxin component of YhaV-PrlF toxin-antitoxin module